MIVRVLLKEAGAFPLFIGWLFWRRSLW